MAGINVTSPYTTSDRYETAVARYAEDMANNWLPQFELICKLSNEPGAAKRVYADYPVGQIGAHDTSTITEMTHGATAVQTATPTAYSAKYKFSEIEQRRNPELLLEAADKLITGCKRTFESLVFSQLPLGISTTEVTTGHDGAAKKIFSDTHGYGTGAGEQSNLGTSALSATSLAAGRVALRKWKTQSGEPAELDRGPLVLVVPPELGDTARRLVGSPEYFQTTTNSADQGWAATGAQINPMADRPFTVCESAYLSDADNWYLINQEHTPLNMWIPSAPSIVIAQDIANRDWIVSVLFEASVYWRAPVSGCYGASVS